jgi:hypothetical protein
VRLQNAAALLELVAIDLTACESLTQSMED